MNTPTAAELQASHAVSEERPKGLPQVPATPAAAVVATLEALYAQILTAWESFSAAVELVRVLPAPVAVRLSAPGLRRLVREAREAGGMVGMEVERWETFASLGLGLILDPDNDASGRTAWCGRCHGPRLLQNGACAVCGHSAAPPDPPTDTELPAAAD